MSTEPEKSDLDALVDAYIAEAKRRIEENPGKISDTAFWQTFKGLTDLAERKENEAAARAAEADALKSHEPLTMILEQTGLPLQRRLELLRDLAHEQRADLDKTEQAIQLLADTREP